MYSFSNALVKKVTYRENVILIEFNEYMHIKEKQHSYLNKRNYFFKVGGASFLLSKNSKIEMAKKGFIIRIILANNFNYNMNTIDNFYLGYTCWNKFFYIQSFQNTIQNILTPIYLEKEIKILNIEDGIAEIVGDNILKYTYIGENEFYSVNLTDFYLKKLNREYYPKLIKKKDNKFIFKFEENTFCEYITDISLNVIESPRSKDIYGLSIKKKSKVIAKDIRSTYVKSLSISNCENDRTYFKIYFSAPLSNFFDRDFLIQHDDILYRCFFESINSEKNIVDIKVYKIKIKNILKDTFKLVLLKNISNNIKTLDYKKEEIIIKEEIISKIFISQDIEWKKINYQLSGSLIKIAFQQKINPSSIISNLNFNQEVRHWDGRCLAIPPKALKIEHNNNISKIILKNNRSFGEILIEYKKNMNFINKMSYNEKPCLLYSNNNEIFIKFNNNEKIKVEFIGIIRIIYNPGKNIRNLNENFIFTGFFPIKYSYLNNYIYIHPLQGSDDNPFIGGVKNCSFVIEVNNECTYRDYGNKNTTTIIKGFFKIIGELNSNQSILINNIKVLGDIYLHVERSNIVFDGVDCNNLIYE